MHVAILSQSSSNFLEYDLLVGWRLCTQLSIFLLHDLNCVFGALANPLCATMKHSWQFMVFFQQAGNLHQKYCRIFPRNRGKQCARAAKKEFWELLLFLIIINIDVIQFFNVGLQDYWPTMYLGSYIFVKVHHSEKFCPFPCLLLELLRR